MTEQRPNIYGEASAQSAELFHLIIENIKDYAIFMTDSNGRVASWNPGVEKVLGYAESEFVGRSIDIIFTPEDAAAGAPLAEMERARAAGCSEDKRWHKRKDGSLFWANGMVMPVKNDDGALRGFAKVMRDDTAQKLAEQKLEQSNRHSETILESITDGFFSLDRDWRFTYLNEQSESLLGRGRQELLGKNIWEQFPEAVGTPFYEQYHKAADEHATVIFEAFYPPLDIWVEVRVYPSPDGLSVYLKNINERKHAELEIQKFASLADNSAEFIGMCDLNFVPFYVNEAGMRLIGLDDVNQFEQSAVEDFFFPEDREFITDEFFPRVLRQGRGEVEIRFRHFKTGAALWMICNVFSIKEADGKLIGWATVCRNITKRKHAEELLVEREKLATLNSELSLALVQSVPLPGILQSCAEVIVKNLDAAFARVWTLDEGQNVLELQASAGIYTHLDGEHARVPVGRYKIGLIAEERLPHLTNSVIGDSRVGNQEWAKREGMVAFAGYPLIIGERLVGVVAMFARRRLEISTLKAIESAANIIALGIERKRAEENLKNQKILLEGLTESVLDGILIVSPEGKMLHFNRRFIDIWNFPAGLVDSQSDEQALEWAANQTIAPAAFLARVGDVYQQPDAKVREEISMKDGRVFERFGAPIHNRDNRLGWVWTFRDITERKRAETNFAFLAEIGQDLTRLTSAREITQTMTDKIGKYLGVSKCLFAEVDTTANTAIVDYCWLKDYEAIDLVGKHQLPEFVSDEFRRALIAGQSVVVNDVAKDSRTGENAARFELLKIGSFINTPFVSDGFLRFILGVYRPEPYKWRADEIELMGELMTRVWTRVARARAEENLRESEERLRALADSIPQLAWMAEPDGFIFWYNRRWYEYTGKTPEEMAGWGWQSVHDSKTLPNVLERWQSSIQTGESFEMEFPLLRGADLTFRWFLTRVVPVRDSDGNIVRWFGTNTDIEELRQARLQAERANSLKDEFLAMLSHELRTPLNAILGWSQVLQSHNLGESEKQKALTTIERNARAQNQLIDDLLDVSRIITGKLRLDVRAVDLPDVITAAVDAARPGAEAKNIRLQVLLDPQAGPISGDPDRLQQIVWNLLSNAVKFTTKGGRLQIRLQRINSHVEIVVSDTGIGIEPEFLPHVFDRFRQSDGSTTRRDSGLGLGLAIVRQLVELHGGTVSVSSDGNGQGSTFTVFLPLLPVRIEPPSNVPRVHPAAETVVSKDCPPELSKLRVLLIEDEIDSRDLLKLILVSCGAAVTTTSSAAEAFETIRREKFDVLISDIGMPEEDGFSLIGRIRELPDEESGNIPAIALTAYARAEDRVRALRSGFQMHIAKPVEPSELIVVVANLAGRMRKPNQNKLPRSKLTGY